MANRDILEDWIAKMREAEFRKIVLLPLFKARGFHNVIHHHGGSGELGKDIVMWKEGEFRNRVNYAVVVKVGKITGSISGKNSFTDVVIQVQQAFGSTYRDETTFEEIHIDQCLISTNIPMSKESMDALFSVLHERIEKRIITCYNYNNLIDDLLVHRIGPDTYDSMMREFDDSDPRGIVQRISISREGKNKIFEMEFSPNTPTADLQGSFSFSFPDNAEGQQYRDKLQAFIDTGTKVEIPKDFISSFQFPSVLELGGESRTIEMISLESAKAHEPTYLDIAITQSGNDVFIGRNLPFYSVERGNKAAKLLCNEPCYAFILELEFRQPNTVRLQYKQRPDRSMYNVVQLFEAMDVLHNISIGGIIRIIDSRSQIVILQSVFDSQKNALNFESLLDIYEKAAYIQKATKTILNIKSAGLSKQDVSDILELYVILHDGIIRNIKGVFSFSLKSDYNREAFAEMTDLKRHAIKASVSQSYEILGKNIDIGEVEYLIAGGKATYENDVSGSVNVKIAIEGEDTATAIYKKYYHSSNNIRP